jgi:hypothetical protein
VIVRAECAELDAQCAELKPSMCGAHDTLASRRAPRKFGVSEYSEFPPL